MRSATAAIVSLMLFAVAAPAAVSVLGNGLAHQCYIAAERGSRFGEDTCTSALDNELLSQRDRAATLVNRGVIRTGMRRLDAALADYNRAIALGEYLGPSDRGVAYVNRASIYNAQGRFAEALADANRGLDLGTFKPEIAYYVRAIARESLGDVKGAWMDYREALRLVPTFEPAATQLKRFHVETRPAGGS